MHENFFQKTIRIISDKIRYIYNWLSKFSFVKHILFFYLLITFGGALLLYSNISQQSNGNVSFINALFVAASAFSDTGLTPVTTAQAWTMFGQAVIAILIFVGGIGFFAIKVYIFNIIIRRPMSTFIRNILNVERGSTKIGTTKSIITVSITVMLCFMLLGTISLMFYFYYVPGDYGYANPAMNNQGIHFAGNDSQYSPYHSWNRSIRFGMFHSISAINNAGFDIMGSHSIAPYYTDYYIQFVFLFLLILGGIGFPVIYDVYMYSKSRVKGEKFRFSLFTKLSCLTYLIISVVGVSLTLIIEITAKGHFLHNASGQSVFIKSYWANPESGTTVQKVIAIVFNTMSTRNAGFATMDFHNFANQTLIVHSIMMFIGSAPSSTAGGIRTTTFAIVILGFWKYLRNKSTVRAFNRRIPSNTVAQASSVFAISVILVITVTLICSTSFKSAGGQISTNQFNYVDVFFEVCSAFGTTGLSTGVTPLLNNASKIAIILLMFIGQLGVSSTLLVWGNKKQKSRRFKYVHEDVTIG